MVTAESEQVFEFSGMGRGEQSRGASDQLSERGPAELDATGRQALMLAIQRQI